MTYRNTEAYIAAYHDRLLAAGPPEDPIHEGDPCPDDDCPGVIEVSEPDEDYPKGSAWCSECRREP